MEQWLEIARLPKESRRERAQERLEQAGVPDAKRVAKEYAELLELPIFAIAATRVTSHLGRVGNPAQAAIAFGHSVRSLEEKRGDASPLFVEPILAISIELAGSSARAASLMANDPALAIELGTAVDLDRTMET